MAPGRNSSVQSSSLVCVYAAHSSRVVMLSSRTTAARPAAFAAPKPSAASPASRSVACDAKKKGVRIIVTLECTEARKEGATPSRYTTQKNKRNTPDRLELRKYNQFLRRYTLHREIKK